MALDTYSDLKSEVADWLARGDLVDKIPTFIRLCEAKLNRDLQCSQMERRSTTSIDMNSDEPEFVSLPGDFQTMRRIRLRDVSGKPELQFLSQSQLDQYRYNILDIAGQPIYFTVFGDELELCPTPSGSYELEMVYRSNVRALSDDYPTNWVLTLAPDIYLYGALMESAPYIKEDARIQTWATGYGYALDGLNSLSRNQAFNAGPAVMKAVGPKP